MTQPALDLFIRRGFLVKVEATEGTDSVPTNVLNGKVVLNGGISTKVDQVERPTDRPYLGSYPSSPANPQVMMTGTFELYAPLTPGATGTSDADCGDWLKMAGFAVTKDNVAKTTTYNPISSAFPSYTMYGYHSGTLVKSLGTRADLKALILKVGDRFNGQFDTLGTYDTYDDSALPSITVPTKVPVVCRYFNSELTVSASDGTSAGHLGGSALADLHLRAKSLQIDLGNTMAHKEYTEYASNGITDRKAKFTLIIAKTDMTNDFNPWYLRDNAILLDLLMKQWELKTKDTIWAGLGVRGQILDIAEDNVDGDYAWSITGNCIPSDAGGDELYVQFGDDTP